ncbi:MAG: AroM family protein [Gemmatimonadales bacterium]
MTTVDKEAQRTTLVIHPSGVATRDFRRAYRDVHCEAQLNSNLDHGASPLLGVVTIGQSPRRDLALAFEAHAPGARVTMRGALDGLSAAEVDRLITVTTDYPLLVRLNDRPACAIAREVLHPLVQQRASELAAEGARAVVIACAGAFPEITCDAPLVVPGKVVPAIIGAITTSRRIGVVTPIEGQVKAAGDKWHNDGFDPVVTWASPLLHAEITRASAVMRSADVSLVVLDCMGHDEAYAAEFAERSGARVVTAQSLTARVAGEWMR